MGFADLQAGEEGSSPAGGDVLLARDIGYLQPDIDRQLDDQVNEVKRMPTAS